MLPVGLARISDRDHSDAIPAQLETGEDRAAGRGEETIRGYGSMEGEEAVQVGSSIPDAVDAAPGASERLAQTDAAAR